MLRFGSDHSFQKQSLSSWFIGPALQIIFKMSRSWWSEISPVIRNYWRSNKNLLIINFLCYITLYMSYTKLFVISKLYLRYIILLFYILFRFIRSYTCILYVVSFYKRIYWRLNKTFICFLGLLTVFLNR